MVTALAIVTPAQAGGPPSSAAAAEPADVTASSMTAAPAPAQSIAVPLFSLMGWSGLAVEYERLAPLGDGDDWTMVAGVGVRAQASGDYGSRSVSASAALRHWPRGTAVWSDYDHAMVGPYAGVRLDVGVFSLRDTIEVRAVGREVSVALTGNLGYRFAPWRGLSITPSFGLGARVDHSIDSRTPPWTRVVIEGGVAAGWMF